jgi:hypothetical protein
VQRPDACPVLGTAFIEISVYREGASEAPFRVEAFVRCRVS